jgi:hypothetical protein
MKMLFFTGLTFLSLNAVAAPSLRCTILKERTKESMSIELKGNEARVRISDILMTYHCAMDTSRSTSSDLFYGCEDSDWSFSLSRKANAGGEYTGFLFLAGFNGTTKKAPLICRF